MKCEVTALLASSTSWNSCPQHFHEHVELFVLLFWFSISCLDDEGRLLPSRYVLWKILFVASRGLPSSPHWVSGSFSLSAFPVSYSLVPVLCGLCVCFYSNFLPFPLSFPAPPPPPCNKSKWVCYFFSFHGPLNCMTLELHLEMGQMLFIVKKEGLESLGTIILLSDYCSSCLYSLHLGLPALFQTVLKAGLVVCLGHIPFPA